MKRILALTLMAASLALVSGTTAKQAEALNPNQTTVLGVVNALYWDLDAFWGQPQRKPGVGYYNFWSNGQLVNYQTECGATQPNTGLQGFYCPGGHIYFDFIQQNGYLTSPGDGAIALWLAHEYAHHAEWFLGLDWTSAPPYHELLADCFAGLYFRYGVYTSKNLNYNDYLEARAMLWRMGTDTVHGTPARRLKAFDYGFGRIGWRSCTNGWQNW